MEFDRADGLAVIPQRLVGTCGKVNVVPEESAVVGANDDIVTTGSSRGRRVYVERRDPAGTWLQDLDEQLSRKVVGTDGALVCDEKDWFRRVEVRCLWRSTALETSAEGILCEVLGEGVDCDGNRRWRG